jgi:TetR/AcrR family transcriptional regulator
MTDAGEGGRRSRIARVAAREFAEYGLAGSRVQRIADNAGVNKQLLFYYFGSKTGLYRSVMEESSRCLTTPAAVADAHATGQLRDELRAVYKSLAESPHLIRLMANDSWTDGLARELAASVMAGLKRRVSDIVTRGQGLGYFRDDADPDSIGHLALSLVLGHQCLTAANPTSVDEGPGCRVPSDSISDLLLRSLEW